MAFLSREVRAYRLERMQKLMRSEECDALAFTSPDWFEWCSNHAISAHSWERPFLLVVTLDGNSFALLSELSRNALEAEGARGTLWLDSAEFYAESADPSRHRWIATQWREMVVDALRRAGLSGARIGVDAVPEWFHDISAMLPRVGIRRLGRALRSLRWIKHAEEIETMRSCAALSDWAMDLYRQELRPGCLLAEIDFMIAARLAAEAARRHPGENFVVNRLATHSGAASACPHGDGAPNGKVLEQHAIAGTTIASRLNGVAMELARPWLVGSPRTEVVRLFDCAHIGQKAAIEVAVAGRTVAGIHRAAQSVFDDQGFASHLRLRAGHGIGVVMHDFPEDLPYVERPLFERETYVVEPSLFLPDVGAFRFADAIVVGAGAPEHLTKAPKERAAQTLR